MAPGRKRTPDQVVISYDKLQLILADAIGRLRKTDDWQAPLGLIIALATALLTGDFRASKKTAGLGGNVWAVVFVIGIILATIWLAIAMARRFQAPTLDNLMSRIVASSISRSERRASFLLQTTDRAGQHRLLVYFDPIWQCYLLPHMKLAAEEDGSAKLEQFVSAMLATPVDRVMVQYLDGVDLESRKMSHFANQMTDYHFQFFHVVLKSPTVPPGRTFRLAGRDFAWMTLNELETAKNWQRNTDVVRHLQDNYRTFFIDTPPSVPRGAI